MFHYFEDDNLTFQDGTSATISLKTWFLFHLLSLFNLIPIIGFIIWIVIFLWIGLRQETAPSIRNYVKLQLIFVAVSLVVAMILIIFGVGFFAALGAALA